MATGFYVGSALSAREYARRGGDAEAMWNLLVFTFVGGLVSSKLLSVADDPRAFLANPVGSLISGSGFVWYGGLLGGALVAWLIARRKRMDFGDILESTAIGIPFGHAIGRLGCHMAGDGDWGTVTNLPWGVAYKNAFIGWNYPEGVRVHPTPIYEAIAYTAIGLLVFGLRKRDLPKGTLFAIYLVLSSLARFLVEFIRIEPVVAFGLTQAQWVAIALFACGAAWLMRKLPTMAIKEAHSR